MYYLTMHNQIILRNNIVNNIINRIKIKLFWNNYRYQIMSIMAGYIISKAYLLKSGYKYIDDPGHTYPFLTHPKQILVNNGEDTEHSIEHYIEIVCTELSQKSSIKEQVFLSLCHFKFQSKHYDKNIFVFIHDLKQRIKERKLMTQIALLFQLDLSDFLNNGFVDQLFVHPLKKNNLNNLELN